MERRVVGVEPGVRPDGERGSVEERGDGENREGREEGEELVVDPCEGG